MNNENSGKAQVYLTPEETAAMERVSKSVSQERVKKVAKVILYNNILRFIQR